MKRRHENALPSRDDMLPNYHPALQALGWVMALGALSLLCEIAWNLAGAF